MIRRIRAWLRARRARAVSRTLDTGPLRAVPARLASSRRALSDERRALSDEERAAAEAQLPKLAAKLRSISDTQRAHHIATEIVEGRRRQPNRWRL